MTQPELRAVLEILAPHRDAIAPGGILDLNPLPRTELERLDGRVETPALTKEAWREIQFRLSAGAALAAVVPSHGAIDAIAATHRRAGTLPITVGCYRYSALRPGVTPEAAAADPAAAVEQRTAFYAAPLAHSEPGVAFAAPASHRGLHVRYILPSELVLTNLGARPKAVTIDFGDGGGSRAVPLDTPIEIDYPALGRKHMRLTAEVCGNPLHAAFVLDVAPAVAMPPVSEHRQHVKGS
jgi:hypothetical protein